MHDNLQDHSVLSGSKGKLEYCKAFGGERMIINDEWFTGNCLVYLKRIRSYHHAYRKPYLQGGWCGCFCSSDCIKEGLGKEDKVILNLIDIIKNDLNTNGIQDKPYTEPEIPIKNDYSQMLDLFGIN